MPILTILFTWRNGVSPRSQRGQLWVARGRFYNRTGWDHGGSTKKKRSVMDCKGSDTQDARGRFYYRTGWDHGGGHHVGLSSDFGQVMNTMLCWL